MKKILLALFILVGLYSSAQQSTEYMAYPYCLNGQLIYHQLQYKNARFLSLGYFSDTTFLSYTMPVGAVAGYCTISYDSTSTYSEHIDTIGVGQTGTFNNIYTGTLAFYNNATGSSRITMGGKTLDWQAALGITPIKNGKRGTVVIDNTNLTAGQIVIVYYTNP